MSEKIYGIWILIRQNEYENYNYIGAKKNVLEFALNSKLCIFKFLALLYLTRHAYIHMSVLYFCQNIRPDLTVTYNLILFS